MPKLLKSILDSHIDYNIFLDIKKAFKLEATQIVKEGGFIKDGFNKELDHLRNLMNNELNQIMKLQKKYSEQKKINSLKIKHNRMLGYHIEVRAVDKSIRDTGVFIHRQTTTDLNLLQMNLLMLKIKYSIHLINLLK